MSSRRPTAGGLEGVLSDPRVLQANRGEDLGIWYSAPGIVQVLTETEHADKYWADLKTREPALARLAERVEFQVDEDGRTIAVDALDLEGVLRLIRSIPSPHAERIKRWMAESARQRLEEAENPELAYLRARKLYEQRGYSRRWIDKRLQGVSIRHELTAEWFRRGAHDSEQYRALTNELIRWTFGMDVAGYRRYKGLSGAGANLRDHLSDLELALVTLAETTAAVLHRARDSQGFERLMVDVQDAGRIVAATAAHIAQAIGGSVTQPGMRAGSPAGKAGHDRPPAQHAA